MKSKMLDNVRVFLGEQGWTWKGYYYNCEKCGYDMAKTFDDIRSNIEHQYTTLQLEKCGTKYYTEVQITESIFRQYTEKYGVQGSDSEMVLDEDYSAEWTEFLADRISQSGSEVAEEPEYEM